MPAERRLCASVKPAMECRPITELRAKTVRGRSGCRRGSRQPHRSMKPTASMPLKAGENLVAAPVAEEVPRRRPSISIRPKPKSGSNRSATCWKAKVRSASTYLLAKLNETAHQAGVELPFSATTPYVNTIAADKQPPYPGQSRNRTPHQKHHPLERDGDGRARQPRTATASAGTFRPTPRPPRCTKWRSIIFSRPRRRFFRRPGLHPRARLAGHLRPRVSRRPIDAKTSSRISARSCSLKGACRAIRIRG